MILTHGILRARYRTSFTPPELLERSNIVRSLSRLCAPRIRQILEAKSLEEAKRTG